MSELYDCITQTLRARLLLLDYRGRLGDHLNYSKLQQQQSEELYKTYVNDPNLKNSNLLDVSSQVRKQTDIIIQKTSNSINQIDKNLNKLTLALKEWINCVTKEKNIMSESLESTKGLTKDLEDYVVKMYIIVDSLRDCNHTKESNGGQSSSAKKFLSRLQSHIETADYDANLRALDKLSKNQFLYGDDDSNKPSSDSTVSCTNIDHLSSSDRFVLEISSLARSQPSSNSEKPTCWDQNDSPDIDTTKVVNKLKVSERPESLLFLEEAEFQSQDTYNHQKDQTKIKNGNNSHDVWRYDFVNRNNKNNHHSIDENSHWISNKINKSSPHQNHDKKRYRHSSSSIEKLQKINGKTGSVFSNRESSYKNQHHSDDDGDSDDEGGNDGKGDNGIEGDKLKVEVEKIKRARQKTSLEMPTLHFRNSRSSSLSSLSRLNTRQNLQNHDDYDSDLRATLEASLQDTKTDVVNLNSDDE